MTAARRLVLGCLLVAGLGPAATPARADAVDAANAVRATGCAGLRAAPALRPSRALDAAAGRVAGGESLATALAAAGYRADGSTSIRVDGSANDAALGRFLAAQYCQHVTNPAHVEAGAVRRGRSVVLVLATPFRPPAARDSAAVAADVLARVNRARAAGARCGARRRPPVAPVALDPVLTRVALDHARDMARHGYLAHTGRDGSEPADRVARAGYAWASVGENVAAGSTTADEVVRGWLESPGHCTNLMDARFTAMGVAYAVEPDSPAGIYWAQVFAAPR